MTNSEMILLSLIAERPRHGYEIESVIEERGMRNWTEIAFSSIYAVLKKLVKSGYASETSAPAAGRGPAKKVYTATTAGSAALRDGVQHSLAEPDLGDQAFLFGLSCLPLLSHDEALAALYTRRQSLLEKQVELTRRVAVNTLAMPAHVTAMFTYSIAILAAGVDWLDNFILDLEEGEIHAG